MTFEMIKPYFALITAILLIIIALIYTIIIYAMTPKEERKGDLPAASIFKETIKDISALLALLLTFVIIILLLAQNEIPNYFIQIYFMVVGYYFGVKKRKEIDPQKPKQGNHSK